MSEETTREEARGEGRGLGKDVPPGTAGAGAQAYPIRALVRAEASVSLGSDMPGRVFNWKGDSYGGYLSEPGRYDSNDPEDYPFSWFAKASDIILNPTPEQIAEERAKLAPALEARSAPEAPAEGFPSQSLPPSPTLETLQAELEEEKTARLSAEYALDSWLEVHKEFAAAWKASGPNPFAPTLEAAREAIEDIIMHKDMYVEDKATAILSLLSPGREGQGTGMGMEPSAPAGLRETLEAAAGRSKVALGYIQREGFVFDGSGDRWEKLAFSLYTDLVDIAERARQALEAEQSDAPEAASDAGSNPSNTPVTPAPSNGEEA